MRVIILKIEVYSSHLEIEGRISRQILLRRRLPFFDLEIHLFPKLRTWSYGIDCYWL